MVRLPQRHDEEIPEFVIPDEGWTPARFLRYDDPKTSQYKNRDGEYPMQIPLIYKITSGEFEGVEVRAYRNLDLNALDKNSIYHDLLSLDPESEPEGDEDLDDYIGRRNEIKIVHRTSKKNPDKTYANVGEVRAARKKAKPAGKAKSKADEGTWEEDEDAA